MVHYESFSMNWTSLETILCVDFILLRLRAHNGPGHPLVHDTVYVKMSLILCKGAQVLHTLSASEEYPKRRDSLPVTVRVRVQRRNGC